MGWVDQRRAGRRAARAADPIPVSRAELASTRRRIEIADALHRIRINGSDAAAIRRQQQSVSRAGTNLRDQSAWAVTGSAGVIAAELLHAEPDSELQQIWTSPPPTAELMKRAYANRDAIAAWTLTTTCASTS